MKVVGKILDFLVFGNIVVSLGTTGLTGVTLYLLDAYRPDLLWFTFFSTLFIYNLSLVLGNRKLKDANSPVRRHQWLLEHDTLLTVMGIAGLLISTYFLLFSFDIYTLVFLAPFGLLAAAYSFPIKIAGKTYVIRESGLNKIFVITLIWGVMTVLLPIVEVRGMEMLLTQDSILLFLSRMAFVFAITIPFDIRDLRYDKETDVTTIPRVLGEKKAKAMSVALMFVFIALTSFLHNPMNHAWKLIFAGLLLSGVTTAIILLFCNKNRPEYYFSFLIEGTSFLQFLFVWLMFQF